jgi:hypothetical protein
MVGHHHLRTPYGVLRVQRFLLGWTVHRESSPLVWYISDKLVIFWSLQDAKLAALVHMNDNCGAGRFVDGTKWLLAAKISSPAPAPHSLSAMT